MIEPHRSNYESNDLDHELTDTPKQLRSHLGNRELPIWERMPEIVKTLQDGNRLVLSSPTGSGKTSQVPQALYENGFAEQGNIYVVVNRVAIATEVAKRVALEMGVKVGREVGYLTGPEKRATADSKIIFVTSGVFKNILQRDPSLSETSVVLLDEFDERDLLTDLSASLIEKAQDSGSRVKFALMSATLNAKKFSEHFNDAPIVETEGRLHPIDANFAPERIPTYDMPRRAAELAKGIHEHGKDGHIFIFMPGAAEIRETVKELTKAEVLGAQILPFHSQVSSRERSRVFEPTDQRKIIVLTNVGERGITVDGLKYVIDSGLVRTSFHDPESDATALRLMECAQDSVKQRMGRAGRTQPGEYHALFTEENYSKRAPSTPPEIQRTSLRDIVLQIKAMGYSREGSPLRIIDYPEKTAWKSAKNQLRILGALDNEDETTLSPFGQKLADLGCGAREGAMILHGSELCCCSEMLTISAIRMSRPLFVRPFEKAEEARQAHAKFMTSPDSDLINSLNAYRAAEAAGFKSSWIKGNFLSYPALRDIRQNEEQLRRRALSVGCKLNRAPAKPEMICKAIARAFSDQVFRKARRDWYDHKDDYYNQRLLGKESSVRSSMIIASELRTITVRSSGRELPLITQATRLDPNWLSKDLESNAG